ncbi:unnamed protein product [Ectocarpus fasciculatus]
MEGRGASGAGGRGDADVTVSDPSVSEELSLLEAVAKHLEPRPGNAPLRHRLKLFAKPWGEAAAAAAAAKTSGAASKITVLGGRQQKQQQQLRLFLQRVPCAAKKPLYWELDGGEPLGTALKGKTVIEHPTVFVTLDGKETAERFPTLVTDLESNDDDIAEDPSRVIGELERAMAPPVPAAVSVAVKEGVEGVVPMDATSEEGEIGDGSSGSSSSESESEGSSSSSGEEDDDSDDDDDDDGE